MVDLGFLLIIFFIFTTSLTTPRVMHLNTPIDETDSFTKVCENCVITVILDKNNQVYYYEGIPDKNMLLQKTSLSDNHFRYILLQKKQKVKRTKNDAGKMAIIIKSTNTKCTYKIVQ